MPLLLLGDRDSGCVPARDRINLRPAHEDSESLDNLLQGHLNKTVVCLQVSFKTVGSTLRLVETQLHWTKPASFVSVGHRHTPRVCLSVRAFRSMQSVSVPQGWDWSTSLMPKSVTIRAMLLSRFELVSSRLTFDGINQNFPALFAIHLSL